MSLYINTVSLLNGVTQPTTGSFVDISRGGNANVIIYVSGVGSNGVTLQTQSPWFADAGNIGVNLTNIAVAGTGYAVLPITYPISPIRAVTSGTATFWASIVIRDNN